MDVNIKKSIKTILLLFLVSLLFNACGSGSKTEDDNSKVKGSDDNIKYYDYDMKDGKLQLNVMILYTKKYQEKYTNTVKARLQNSIDVGNDILKNSKIDIKLNLVHTQMFDDTYLNEDIVIFTALNSPDFLKWTHTF